MIHRIAVIPGDGIGKEVVPEGARVLEAAGQRFGFELRVDHVRLVVRALHPRPGRMMPEDGLDAAPPSSTRSSSARSAFPACPTTSRCGAC